VIVVSAFCSVEVCYCIDSRNQLSRKAAALGRTCVPWEWAIAVAVHWHVMLCACVIGCWLATALVGLLAHPGTEPPAQAGVGLHLGVAEAAAVVIRQSLSELCLPATVDRC